MSAAKGVSTIQRLIADHIGATAEHERLYRLNDWGMCDDEAVSAAIDAIDEALLEICRARPIAHEDVELRRRYLADKLAKEIDGCLSLTQRAISALIDDGGGPA